jgi:hypothetical protein
MADDCFRAGQRTQFVGGSGGQLTTAVPLTAEVGDDGCGFNPAQATGFGMS